MEEIHGMKVVNSHEETYWIDPKYFLTTRHAIQGFLEFPQFEDGIIRKQGYQYLWNFVIKFFDEHITKFAITPAVNRTHMATKLSSFRS